MLQEIKIQKWHLFFGFLIFLSCGQSGNNKLSEADDKAEPNLIVFDEQSEFGEVFKTGEIARVLYSDIVEKVSFIPLETTSESILSSISQLCLIDSTFVIFDRGIEEVLLFDYDGNYLRSIGSRGFGDGEFVTPYGIDVDEQSRQIFILDFAGHKILVFSVEGELIREIRYEFEEMVKSFKYLGNNYFVLEFSSGINKRSAALGIIDSDGNLINTLLDDLGIYNPFSLSPGPFFRYGDAIRYVSMYLDTIYELKGTEIRPIIKVNSEYPMDLNKVEEHFMKANPNESHADQREGVTWMSDMSNYVETKKFIMFSYKMPKSNVALSVFVDKGSDLASAKILVNDLHQDYHVYWPLDYSDENKLIQKVDPANILGEGGEEKMDDFKDLVLSTSSPQMSPEMKQRLDDLNVNSNPVLVVYHLKQ